MAATAPRERIVRNLQDAVERLHDDIARVELWADALGGFAQPIPDYDPSACHLNRYLLPEAGQSGGGARESVLFTASKKAKNEPRTGAKNAPERGPGEDPSND